MANQLALKFNTKHAAKMEQRVALLMMKPGDRKRVFKGAGSTYLKATRNHIRKQKTLFDQPMEPRKRGRGKMLKKMGRGLKVKASSKQVSLGWGNKMVARIASRHQFGIDEVMTASRMEKIHGRSDYQSPATKKQAKALISAGFTIGSGTKYKSGSNKGKSRRKRPSRRWIVENMSLGQAGMVIRKLKNTTNPPKRWIIPVPARPFLGVTAELSAKVLSTEISKRHNRKR